MKSKAANYVPVILAGGSGTRLWPLSRTEYPKQFLALAGEQSLLQATVTRFTDHSTSSPVVVCSEQHRFLTAEQLLSIGVSDASILLEPVARNTAPAIGLAAWQVHNSDPDGVMVVLPADHVIDDIEQLQNSVSHAVELAEAGYMVTLGIKPTSPATGYGYISAASPLPGFDSGAMAVSQFIEKPNEAKAAELIATNQCF